MVLGEVCKGSRNVSLTFLENKISNICILIQQEFSSIINTWIQKFPGSLLHTLIPQSTSKHSKYRRRGKLDLASLMKLKTYIYKAPSRGLKPINSSNNYSQNYVENNLEPVLTQAACALPTELMVPQFHRTHCSLDSHSHIIIGMSLPFRPTLCPAWEASWLVFF